MASVNKVILLGTLGRDPEVRFSANQLPIASLSLATSSFRRSAESQDRIEETEWHRVTLFGRQAEIAQQYLRKGSRAYIEGRLRTRKYEKDGQTHYVTEIVAELLELIDVIDNPNVQICIDTGHANMVGLNVPDMIRQVGSHLKATHINDNYGIKDEHFSPFNGTIPWKEVVQALRDIDYQECFAFETHHLTSMYPKEVQPYLVDFSYALGEYLLKL